MLRTALPRAWNIRIDSAHHTVFVFTLQVCAEQKAHFSRQLLIAVSDVEHK